MTNLKDTLANITRAIVDKPEEIIIVEKEDGEHVTLELSVSPFQARTMERVAISFSNA